MFTILSYIERLLTLFCPDVGKCVGCFFLCCTLEFIIIVCSWYDGRDIPQGILISSWLNDPLTHDIEDIRRLGVSCHTSNHEPAAYEDCQLVESSNDGERRPRSSPECS